MVPCLNALLYFGLFLLRRRNMAIKEVQNNLRVLSDGEIELRLNLGLEATGQFYYIMYSVSTNEKVGQCGIRMQKNEENYYLGNIEYEILPHSRGNHYAEKATRLLAIVASCYDVDKLIITANPENKSSIRTIENLGAHFIEVKNVPKNMRLYRSGTPYVSIYEWDLNEKGERKK